MGSASPDIATLLLLATAGLMTPKLQPLQKKVDPQKCMGNWYVQWGIPAVPALERGGCNGLEEYTYDEQTGKVQVRYTFNQKAPDGPINESFQVGRVKPGDAYGTTWQTKVRFGSCIVPYTLPYYILECAEDYSYLTATGPVFTAPGGSWLYVMTREKVVDDASLEPRFAALRQMGVDLELGARMTQTPAVSPVVVKK